MRTEVFFSVGNARCPEGCSHISRHLAAQGFVVASINYRLEGHDHSGDNNNKIRFAVEDMRAAMRFLMLNYDIDRNNMFFGGDSSGAIASVWAGFINDTQVEGASGNYGVETVGKIQGLFTVSAGLGGKSEADLITTNSASWKRPKLVALVGGNDMQFVNHAVDPLCHAAGLDDQCAISVPDGGHVPLVPYTINGGGNSVDIMQNDNEYLCQLTSNLHAAKFVSRSLSDDVFV